MEPRVKTSLLKILFLGGFATAAWAGSDAPVIDVYKSPSCGCCGKWVDYLKTNGFTVRSHDTYNVMQHKQRLGVPPGKGSCHTAEIDGYLVEGLVPADDIKRLLYAKPNARGLMVPDMPMGSPGMEVRSYQEPYDVLLVNHDGSTQTFTRY